MSSRFRLMGLGLSLTVTGLFLCLGCQVNAGNGKKWESEADSSKVRAVPVETETITTATMSARLHVNGILETESAVQIYPQVPGHVAVIHVEEGDRVSTGDTLLRLEDAELLLAERRLRLERDKAFSDLRLVEAMLGDSLVARQDVEDAIFTADRAQLNWESAQLQVERSRVRAPIPGVISLRDVQVGDYVSGAKALFTLVDDSEFISVLDVPERELSRLKKGQPVRAEVGAAGYRDLAGWIKRISPVVDPGSGTVRVTVGLGNEEGLLRSGMYARFSIITEVKENAIALPKRALVYDRDQLHVWIAGDSLAERRRVQRGFEDEFRIEVLEGVASGEQLIIVGQGSLKGNTPIRVIRADGVDVPQPDETSTADAAKTPESQDGR